MLLAVFCVALRIDYLRDKPLELLDNYTIPSEFVFNSEKIALAWTDDNAGETLIIQSDKKEYSGFNQTDAYFSITNISKEDQEMDAAIWLEDGERSVESIERINDGQNVKLQITNVKSNLNDKIQNRKDNGGNTNGYAVKDSIKSGETNFYKAALKFPPMSEGEFFIEAFSAQGGYGHLDPWYSSSWTYRKHIIIDHTKVVENLTDFPVLVSTTDTDLSSKARTDGYDIVFTSLAGTKLNHEIEKYVSGTGELVAWVKVPSLSSIADTVLYMYYGNASAADQQNVTGTWDSNFVMVQHLKEDPSGAAPQMLDSTSNNNDGTSAGTMTTSDQVPGQVDGALDFDGVNDYVGAGSGSSLDNIKPLVVSAWIYPRTSGEAQNGVIVSKNGWELRLSGTTILFLGDYTTTDLKVQSKYSAYTLNTWSHIVLTWDGSTTASNGHIFINGIEVSSYISLQDAVGTMSDAAENLLIGNNKYTSYTFDGLIDEARVSNTARTAGWITTEYNNQSSVGTFMTIGAEEDNTPTEFVSTIRASGGDYNTLSGWEDAVECDLTAATTRVFSGAKLGTLSENNLVELYRGGVDTGIDSYVVATSAGGQILVDGITGASYDLVAQNNDIWRKDASNYWTISGATGNQLGDSAIAIAQIDGAWASADTTAVDINGWTTSATNYIKVYTTESARHNGKWDTGKYRLEASNSYGVINNKEEYVRIDGLQIKQTGIYVSSWPVYAGIFRGGGLETVLSDIRISNNIIKGSSLTGSDYTAGITNYGYNINFKVWNNIIYDFNKGILFNYIGSSNAMNVYIYNNTVINFASSGIYVSGWSNYSVDLRLKNNLVQQSNYTNYGIGGSLSTSGLVTREYVANLSKDATSLNTELRNKTVAFISEANDDFHLAHSDSNAKDAGADLSVDAYLPFSDDIDGDTRRVLWDIGADETYKATQINSPQTNLLTSGLVGYWSFNGPDVSWGATDYAYDRSGQGNNGTIMNMDTASAVAGKAGQALQFDGVDDLLNCGSDSSVMPDAFSFSAWIKTSRNAANSPLFGFAYGTPGMYLATGAGQPLLWMSGNNYRYWSATNPISIYDNMWHHVVAVMPGSSQNDITNSLLYVDNKLQAVSATFNTSGQNAKDRFRIGTNNGYFYQGNIDEARLYNRALTADEIGQLYRAGARTMKIDPTKGFKTIIGN